jgi:hypothetical protein
MAIDATDLNPQPIPAPSGGSPAPDAAKINPIKGPPQKQPTNTSPIIPTHWKVCLVVGVIFSLTLFVVIQLHSHGIISLEPDHFTALVAVTGVYASCQAISIALLIGYYFCEKKSRAERLRKAQESLEGVDTPADQQAEGNAQNANPADKTQQAANNAPNTDNTHRQAEPDTQQAEESANATSADGAKGPEEAQLDSVNNNSA